MSDFAESKNKLYAMELSGIHVRKSIRIRWKVKYGGQLYIRVREFRDVFSITHNKLGTVKITGVTSLSNGVRNYSVPHDAEIEIL